MGMSRLIPIKLKSLLFSASLCFQLLLYDLKNPLASCSLPGGGGNAGVFVAGRAAVTDAAGRGGASGQEKLLSSRALAKSREEREMRSGWRGGVRGDKRQVARGSDKHSGHKI